MNHLSEFVSFNIEILDVGSASNKFLLEANRKGEWVTKLFMQTCFGFFMITVILGFALVIYCFKSIGGFDAEELFLPYNYEYVSHFNYGKMNYGENVSERKKAI